MKHSFRLVALLPIVLALQGCTPQAPAANAPPAYKLTASIQDIMQSIVDPAADTLWEAVETTLSKKGEVIRTPKNDEEWIKLRHLALQLAESANLLAIDGRTVVHEGKALEDSHVAGILTAADIDAKIRMDRGAFIARARALQETAEEALRAIDARDAKQLVVAGGHIDTACEQCHMVYWYPNDKRPTTVPAISAK